MPFRKTKIEPPITVNGAGGAIEVLSTVADVIHYVRRHDTGASSWHALRDAAFVAAAVPSDEHIAALRELVAATISTRLYLLRKRLSGVSSSNLTGRFRFFIARALLLGVQWSGFDQMGMLST